MSASKKKQEEKNLKILREMLTYEGNKYCFDCNQRGPTYVNMTIGSFVCTNCGGALRKYSHRVKSISMSNFNQTEMDFIKTRGNDICKRIYYGLCDNKMPPEFDTKNGMLDSHLRSKYEIKKWYVEPTPQLVEEAIRINQVIFDRAEKPSSQTGKLVGNKMISVNSSSSIIIEPPRSSSTRSNPPPISNVGSRGSIDLVAPPPITSATQAQSNGTVDPTKLSGGSAVKLPMPNAASNNIRQQKTTSGTLFDSDDLFSGFNQQGSVNSGNHVSNSNVPISKSMNFSMEPIAPISGNQAVFKQPGQQNMTSGATIDKYAALAELDDLFSHSVNVSHQQHHPQSYQTNSVSGGGGFWNTGDPAHYSPPVHNPFTDLPQQQQQHNPFATTPHWPNTSQQANNPFLPSSTNQSATFNQSSANPFL